MDSIYLDTGHSDFGLHYQHFNSSHLRNKLKPIFLFGPSTVSYRVLRQPCVEPRVSIQAESAVVVLQQHVSIPTLHLTDIGGASSDWRGDVDAAAGGEGGGDQEEEEEETIMGMVL